MSTRYVWDKYSIKKVLVEMGERASFSPYSSITVKTYTQVKPSGNLFIGISGEQIYTLSEGESISVPSGRYAIVNYGGVMDYLKSINGRVEWEQDDRDGEWGFSVSGFVVVGAKTQKDSFLGIVSSQNKSEHPDDDYYGSYWYTYKGSDSIDPISVSIPESVEGKNGITATVTPSTSKIYEGTITYRYEYSINNGSSWTLSKETTATSLKIAIPTNAKTIQVRARAADDMGFASGTYITSSVAATVTWNSAPTSPGSITIPEVIRGGEDTSIIWSAATDPDGNLDGYIVERSYNGGSSWTQIYQGRSTSTTTTIPFGTETVMFRVQAYDTAGAKSGWRTSANKTVVNNRAPAAPPSISVPLTPAGGESLSVTWTASTDTDGNLEGYELERQWDGAGAFTQIYKGAALSFQDSIPKGEHTNVVYRVRAYDSFAAYSSYTTSPSRTIDNNTAPVIACDLSGDLGEKSEGFSIQYTIKDAEKQEVTVTEKVGDMVKRTYKATLDEQATFEITDEYFQKILNGAQTVQIVATDSAGKSSTLSLTFTKAVHKAVITLSEPLAVEEQITVAVLAVTGDIPADAVYQVEMTNNGNDPEPVWEDATADVKAGRNYVFQNKTQTNGWAFNFRVTAERGESDEDGYIVSIQGGFQ